MRTKGDHSTQRHPVGMLGWVRCGSTTCSPLTPTGVRHGNMPPEGQDWVLLMISKTNDKNWRLMNTCSVSEWMKGLMGRRHCRFS